MSSRSMGVGDGLLGSPLAGSDCSVGYPRALRIVDIWGNFFALDAAPSTKTNLDTRSFAICWRACSLVCKSTLACSCGYDCL